MVKPLKMAVLLLSVPTPPDQCLLHLHPTYMTDLPTYLPQTPASNCSYQRGGARPSASFPGNWRANLTSIPTLTGNLPFLPGRKPAAMFCQPLWEVAPGPCFKHVSSPIHETIDVSVADSGLSSVLKLGKCKLCRRADCSPTEGKREGRNQHLLNTSLFYPCAGHLPYFLQFLAQP